MGPCIDQTDLAEMMSGVRAWAQRHYPANRLQYIEIHLAGIPVALVLADPPTGQSPNDEQREDDAQREDDEPGRGRRGLHRCTKDILATLEAVGKPLTKTRLIDAMDKRCRAGQAEEWSESTICRKLAELMEDGTLINPEGVRPRGYRITE